MNLEQEFDERIAAIHFGTRTDSANSGATMANVRHEEFRAMTDVFLGPDYDQQKIDRVEKLQIGLQQRQAELVQELEQQNITAVQYVDQFNHLLETTFAEIENIIGSEDFHKLFGAPRDQLGGYIDKQAFLERH